MSCSNSCKRCVTVKGLDRDAQLQRLAAIPGVYVPALYPLRRTPKGELVPDTGNRVILKRSVASLDTTAFPTDYIVPFTGQVHDRVSLEVLRGCTQGCRFCQAGMLYRPVRERSLDTLAALTKETIAKTGYEEIALSSLSTCDYSQVRGLVDQAVGLGMPENVAISLPSLRLDSFSVDLADMVASIRKTGLTFAPEAASPRLRAVIDKWIPDEELIDVTEQVFARGWDVVKLYFMIGLPTEQDADVDRHYRSGETRAAERATFQQAGPRESGRVHVCAKAIHAVPVGPPDFY